MPLITLFPQGVLDRLHQEVPDPALTMRHADIHRHRRNAAHGQHLTHHNFADHGAIAVRDHQLIVDLGQRQQGFCGLLRDGLLLLGSAADVFRMHGVPADGNHKAARNFIKCSHNGSPSCHWQREQARGRKPARSTARP